MNRWQHLALALVLVAMGCSSSGNSGNGDVSDAGDVVSDSATQELDALPDESGKDNLVPDIKEIVPDQADAIPDQTGDNDADDDVNWCPEGCDDGDECTSDRCDAGVGCVHEPVEGCCSNQNPFKNSFDDETSVEGFEFVRVVPTYPDAPNLKEIGWGYADLKSHSPGGALYFGDVEQENYDNGHRVAADAISPAFTLDEGYFYTLTFWLYLGVEEGPYADFLTLWADLDGERYPLWSKGTLEDTGSWISRSVDLSPFAGQTIRLVFRFDSSNEVENSAVGVFVDDISVVKECETTNSCVTPANCDDGNACTTEQCVEGACVWTFNEDCCFVFADCEDWDNCTIEKCVSKQCAFQIDPDPACCNENEQCNDLDDLCTVDVCKNGQCTFVPSGAAGCCTTNQECNDGDECTIDYCIENGCLYVNICCTVNGDCDDGDDVCTVDFCSNGVCQFSPSGAEGCCFTDVVDEDFEDGVADGWVFEAVNVNALAWEVGSFDAYQGDKSLAIDGNNVAAVLSAQARLPVGTIPPVGAHLSFYLKMNIEYSGNCNNNRFVVTLDGEALTTYCNTVVEWVKVDVPLAAHAGETGVLAFNFYVGTTSLGDYSVFVDKVKLVQECCTTNQDCNDDNPCTADTCPGANSICQFDWIPGCCRADSECEDENPCTLDSCEDNECSYVDQCCETDDDCNDFDDVCTLDRCIGSWCYFQPTGEAGCCEEEQFFESFEIADFPTGWTVSNTSTQYGWKVSNFQAHSGSYSMYYGDQFATTYGTSNSGSVTTPEMTIPAAPQVLLKAWVWYDTETNYDELSFIVVSESGTSTLAEMSGNSMGWVEVSYDITAMAGQNVSLRASFSCDGSSSEQGVFVDDIRIEAACCEQDSECNDDNPCTEDFCPGTQANCANVPLAGCCLRNDDCWDGNICTVDRCMEDNTCTNTDVCCETDSDCNDNDDVCTNDLCINDFCYFQPTGAAGCCIPNVVSLDFEDGSLANWVIENSQSAYNWRIGTVQTFGGSDNSLYYGNDLENGYGPSITASITSKEWIQLPAAEELTLEFETRYYVESCCDDSSLYLVTETGETFLAEYNGDSAAWVHRSYDLSQYSGQKIKLKFTFHSDSSVQYQGVWYDNIVIHKSCCTTNDECNDGNPCTADSCPGEQSDCINQPVAGCCLVQDDCDDADSCTVDTCAQNQCQHVNVCCDSDDDCLDEDDLCTLDQCVNSFCQHSWIPGPTCCQEEFLGHDFESGSLPIGFVATSNNTSTWHVSTTSAVSGTHSLAFSDSTGANYGLNTNAALTTTDVDLTQGVDGPRLSFWVRYDTEVTYDKTRVYVVDGATETLLDTFTGHSGSTWVRKEYALDAYVGKVISFKFLFTSDGSVSSYFGVNIDDLMVLQDCCHSAADCGDSNPCTVDACTGSNGYCTYEAIGGCCLGDGECADEDDCTLDRCLADHTCSHLDVCCTVDEDCSDGDDLCTYDLCNGDSRCEFIYTGAPGCCSEPLFSDSFATNKGWTYGTQWQRGQATASSCAYSSYSNDPALDHTGSVDDYIAGVVIGGCVNDDNLATYYLTSPVINAAGQTELHLGYWRWLNSDKTEYIDNVIEVFDGVKWTQIWASGAVETKDSAWTWKTHDISAFANANLKVRFGVKILSSYAWSSPSWNLDDIVVYRSSDLLCCSYDTDCSAFGLLCGNGACVTQCVPYCIGKDCGADGCGGTCGVCPQGDTCTSSGLCCTPQCDGKSCGEDGCGGSCGSCGANQNCLNNVCECVLDSVSCGDVCCTPGDVCFEGSCCSPVCDGKECGDDSCGGVCGECAQGMMCGDSFSCECSYQERVFSTDVQKASSVLFGAGGLPGEALDVDDSSSTCSPVGCVDGLDNQLGGVVAQMSGLVDFNQLLMDSVADGTVTILLEFEALDLGGQTFTVNVYTGQPQFPATTCDFLTQSCPYDLDREAFDPDTCHAFVSLDNAQILGDSFKAGGAEYTISIPMPLGNGVSIPAVATRARITGRLVQDASGWHLEEGLIAGALDKELLLQSVEQIPDDWQLPLAKSLIVGILDSLLVPDIDTDGDGISDAVSVGLKFETVPGSIHGVLP